MIILEKRENNPTKENIRFRRSRHYFLNNNHDWIETFKKLWKEKHRRLNINTRFNINWKLFSKFRCFLHILASSTFLRHQIEDRTAFQLNTGFRGKSFWAREANHEDRESFFKKNSASLMTGLVTIARRSGERKGFINSLISIFFFTKQFKNFKSNFNYSRQTK